MSNTEDNRGIGCGIIRDISKLEPHKKCYIFEKLIIILNDKRPTDFVSTYNEYIKDIEVKFSHRERMRKECIEQLDKYLNGHDGIFGPDKDELNKIRIDLRAVEKIV